MPQVAAWWNTLLALPEKMVYVVYGNPPLTRSSAIYGDHDGDEDDYVPRNVDDGRSDATDTTS